MKLYFCTSCATVYEEQEVLIEKHELSTCHDCYGDLEPAQGQAYDMAMDDLLDRTIQDCRNNHEDFKYQVEENVARKLKELHG